MPLEPGEQAPRITAPNQDGETVALAFADPTVVYFYPRDDTPGCTVEADQFNLELSTYQDAGVEVYGVSVDTVESHRDFAEKLDIEFDLLADPDGDIADAFGVARRDSGVTERTTFVAANGRIHAVYTGVDPDGHARAVLGNLLDTNLASLD